MTVVALLRAEYLQIESHDFTGLQTGQGLRIFFKLTPLLYLWLVPMSNPTAVVQQLDRELGDGAGDSGEASRGRVCH